MPFARSAPPPSGTPAAAVASLLARPLRLPTIPAGTDCPVTQARPLAAGEGQFTTNVFGTGPLYPLPPYLGPNTTLRLSGETPRPDGLYEKKVVWANKGGYTGPAVVRIGRLDGPGHGQVRLYYDAAASQAEALVFGLSNDPTQWPSGTFVSGPGCYAYLIEGTTFSDTIIFKVTA
ncbi:hypothetical protein GA0070613_4271 [Micromonospora inositola]|uniref:Uncharacterized protein n=2 Tax=Micromonospora inositola TaxID=47865 RepID=A0A1C5J9I8_9ACTN|nr:hypothetical protein GA0070613_4271 [Micromonospora inositola]